MILIREASSNDCRFIAQIILMAESTGFEVTSYEKMFEMPQSSLLPSFEKMINNPTKGHPLTYNSYLIAEVEGKPAAAISAYVEGEQGDSNHLMTGALMSGFDRKAVIAAFGFLKKHADISIPKKRNTMQIDCVATLPEFRGKGLLKSLVLEAEKTAAGKNVNELQIQVWRKNANAIAAYEKLGFVMADVRTSSIEPDNGKVLMTKTI